MKKKKKYTTRLIEFSVLHGLNIIVMGNKKGNEISRFPIRDVKLCIRGLLCQVLCLDNRLHGRAGFPTCACPESAAQKGVPNF